MSRAVVLLVLLLLAACSDPPPSPRAGSTGGPATSPAPTTTASEPKRVRGRRVPEPRTADLPDLVGLELTRAVRTAYLTPFPPAYRYVVRGGCGSPETVLTQDPAPGRRRTDRAVVLEVVVGRCPLDPALRAVARAFVGFARGGPAPATSDRVALMLGHQVLAVLDERSAAARRRWTVCPAEGTYAARVCPFDLLGAFARGRTTLDTTPPAHSCLASGRLLPAGLAGLRTVTVTRRGSCVDHAAVRLWVDGDGRVVAADLEVPEP